MLDPSNQGVKPVHLNEHIDYSTCCAPSPNAETENSLAFPVGLAISSKRSWFGQLLDSQDLYVAALGSDKVAVLNTSRSSRPTAGQIVQDRSDHIEVRGGPAGLELDEERDRLYVLARFTNELVVVSTRSRRVIERHKMFNPEPASIVEGRQFLYDARRTSSHGDSACASCHIFGDFDGLSWDLGAPDDRDFANLGPFFAKPEVTSFPLVNRFLAVKGPMNTQSLRGMANHGSMHWRGDRRGGVNSTVHAQPDTGAFDENAAFNAFNVAIAGLNGNATELPDRGHAEVHGLHPPGHLSAEPDPAPGQRAHRRPEARAERLLRLRHHRRVVRPRRVRGRPQHRRGDAQLQLRQSARVPAGSRAAPRVLPAEPGLHAQGERLPEHLQRLPHARSRMRTPSSAWQSPGLFGSSAFYTNDAVSHVLKIPHLRNMYQKVGMFGSVQTRRGVGLTALADSIFGPREGGLLAAQNAHTGDQIRGFGFTHAGEEDTIFHFFSLSGFARAPAPGGPLPNDNSAGFEATLPRDFNTCYGSQLPSAQPAVSGSARHAGGSAEHPQPAR